MQSQIQFIQLYRLWVNTRNFNNIPLVSFSFSSFMYSIFVQKMHILFAIKAEFIITACDNHLPLKFLSFNIFTATLRLLEFVLTFAQQFWLQNLMGNYA